MIGSISPGVAMRVCLLALTILLIATPILAGDFPIPQVDFETWRPPLYECKRSIASTEIGQIPLVVDGRLDDAAWKRAEWTGDFVDIEGDLRPRPRHRTRVKMLHDDSYLYIGAVLEEPHLWATLTDRDAVIYHDNDFEVFIDPDGDAHNYYELEINALGTVWDLLLTRPYRDGGHAVDAWNITGLKSAVHLDGTLNDPSDIDRGWSVELALPWSVLEECARHSGPPDRSPFDRWRINFSRVQWRLDVEEGKYSKSKDPRTGLPLPENNWVWSPQGLIAMHYPEMWGWLEFEGGTSVDPDSESDSTAFRLPYIWQIYYAQKQHFATYGHYANDLADLTPLPGGLTSFSRAAFSMNVPPEQDRFSACQMCGTNFSVKYHIDDSGMLSRILPRAGRN